LFFPDKERNNILQNNSDLLKDLSRAKKNEMDSTSKILLIVCIYTIKCLNRNDLLQANQLKESLKENRSRKMVSFFTGKSKLDELIERTIGASAIALHEARGNIEMTDEGYLLPRKNK
jgi:hypothetical protein